MPLLPFVVPRGKYTVDFHQKYMKLHGQSYNYTVNYRNVLKAFFLDEQDKELGHFVIGFDKPLRQGQTLYHFVIIQFKLKEESVVEFTAKEELIKTLDPSFEPSIKGLHYELFTKVFKALTSLSIVAPGDFKTTKGENSLKCSLGARQGILFILNKSFLFITKPVIHVRFEDVVKAEFHRVTTGHRIKGFDLEILPKTGSSYLFSDIDIAESDVIMKFLVSNKVLVTQAKEEDNKAEDEEEDDNDNEDGSI